MCGPRKRFLSYVYSSAFFVCILIGQPVNFGPFRLMSRFISETLIRETGSSTVWGFFDGFEARSAPELVLRGFSEQLPPIPTNRISKSVSLEDFEAQKVCTGVQQQRRRSLPVHVHSSN